MNKTPSRSRLSKLHSQNTISEAQKSVVSRQSKRHRIGNASKAKLNSKVGGITLKSVSSNHYKTGGGGQGGG